MFKAITFDCFGTLIDWRSGQRRVLEQFPSLRAQSEKIDDIISARGAIEIELQQQAWRNYESILRDSIEQAVTVVCGEALTPTEARAFAASQIGWPLFPDTLSALKRLSQNYPLGLLSNCDEQSLKLCAHKHFSGVAIRLMICSESLRSYKPNHAHWGALLGELECDPHQVLHVSFSPEYDLHPAAELGFSLAFIDREGCGVPANIDCQFVADDLQGLSEQLLK